MRCYEPEGLSNLVPSRTSTVPRETLTVGRNTTMTIWRSRFGKSSTPRPAGAASLNPQANRNKRCRVLPDHSLTDSLGPHIDRDVKRCRFHRVDEPQRARVRFRGSINQSLARRGYESESKTNAVYHADVFSTAVGRMNDITAAAYARRIWHNNISPSLNGPLIPEVLDEMRVCIAKKKPNEFKKQLPNRSR